MASLKFPQRVSRKKKRHPNEMISYRFPTNFCDIIKNFPPPAPPGIAKGIGRLVNPGFGKVKVLLKICSPLMQSQSEPVKGFLTIDPRRKQITVYDPAASGYITTPSRKSTITAPKMFAFDGIFSPDDSLSEVCAGSLADILISVINGTDGCLFTYGHSKLGKTFTMIGNDYATQSLGVIPCAISWLFKLIDDQKETTGARFSVRVSAVEVSGAQEILTDLLFEFNKGDEQSKIHIREDPICGTQLENLCEIRAPSADKAAFYLDGALAARRRNAEDDGRLSHLLFTLHVYQYRIEKANQAGIPGVAGGRSRLHLIDLGSTARSKDPGNTSLSLSALGNVITALLNGQRHLPHRDSKIAQLLRDSLGNTTCKTCILVHVSSALQHYAETLQIIQMAARIHRMKRRKSKISSNSSEDSSTDGSRQSRRPYKGFRMGTLREDMFVSSPHSDPDNYTSSSEQSCDTAIYLGASGYSLSDRDVTDNEGPPRSVPRTNPRLARRSGGSRSSGDESCTSDSGKSVTFSYNRLTKAQLNGQNGIPLFQSHSAPCSPQNDVNRAKMKKQNFKEFYNSQFDKDKKTRFYTNRQFKFKVAAATKTEQWIDGPIYSEPISKEYKLVAPGQVIKEQWIDGPELFTNFLKHDKSDSLRKRNHIEERWVDGPQEMIQCANNDQLLKYCHTSMLKLPLPSVQTLKHAIIKNVPESKQRSDSNINYDSTSSVQVKPSTCPSDSSSNDQLKNCISVEDIDSVEPFVEKWVLVHHEQIENDGSSSTYGLNSSDGRKSYQSLNSGTINSPFSNFEHPKNDLTKSYVISNFEVKESESDKTHRFTLDELNPDIMTKTEQRCKRKTVSNLSTHTQEKNELDHKSKKELFCEKDSGCKKNNETSNENSSQSLITLTTVRLAPSLKSNISHMGLTLCVDQSLYPENRNMKDTSNVNTKSLGKSVKTMKSKYVTKNKLLKKQLDFSQIAQKIDKHNNCFLNIDSEQSYNDPDSEDRSQIIMARKETLLSPYAKITKPKAVIHSSSGHGSDYSSMCTDLQSYHDNKIHGGTSSGYESMLRESEASLSEDEEKSPFCKKRINSKKAAKRKHNKALELKMDYVKPFGESKMKQLIGAYEDGLKTKLNEKICEEMGDMKLGKNAPKVYANTEESVNNLDPDDNCIENPTAVNYFCPFWSCISCRSTYHKSSPV